MSENENIGQSENPKKTLPLWRRILVALVLLAMLLLAGSMLASFWMGRQLGRQIAAISQAGEPLTFPDPKTDQPALTDPNDAARLYREALMSISSAHLQQLTNFNLAYRSQIISLPPDQIAQPVREQAAKFEEILQPVLEKIDQAASMDLGHFDLEITKGLKIFMDRLTRANICSLMMSLRTLDHIAHNQADAAADSAVGMLKLVRILDDQPLVNTLPTRIQGAGLASEDIRLLLERTEPSPAALIKLQQALEKVHPENLLVKMLLAERVYQLEVARNLIPSNIAEQYLSATPAPLPERLKPRSSWTRLRLRRNTVNYLHAMAQMIAAAGGSWPGLIDHIKAVEPAKEQSEQKGKTVVEIAQIIGETVARVRATGCLLAIARYRCDHQKLPAALEELVGDYLAAVPADPFTGAALIYKQDEKGFQVYSVGRDRKDDGGSFAAAQAGAPVADLVLRVNFTPPFASPEAATP